VSQSAWESSLKPSFRSLRGALINTIRFFLQSKTSILPRFFYSTPVFFPSSAARSSSYFLNDFTIGSKSPLTIASKLCQDLSIRWSVILFCG